LTIKQALLPIVVIIGVVALLAYAILASGSNDKQTQLPQQTPHASLPPDVQFVSPLDGETLANPVTVRMAVGGVRFEAATPGVTARAGYGHLYLIIDRPAPAAGAKLSGGPPDIDLADASHVAMLPALAPGPHTLTVLFVDSADTFYDAALMQAISISVSG